MVWVTCACWFVGYVTFVSYCCVGFWFVLLCCLIVFVWIFVLVGSLALRFWFGCFLRVRKFVLLVIWLSLTGLVNLLFDVYYLLNSVVLLLDVYLRGFVYLVVSLKLALLWFMCVLLMLLCGLWRCWFTCLMCVNCFMVSWLMFVYVGLLVLFELVWCLVVYLWLLITMDSLGLV